MKSFYNIQKISIGFVLFILTVSVQAQFEHLIELDPQRSVIYGKYLGENSPSEILIYVQSEEYTSNNNRWIHGNPHTQKNLLTINTENGSINSSVPFSMPYATNSYFHAYGNTMAGFRGEKSTTSRPAFANGTGTLTGECLKLVLGAVDTVTKIPIFYKEPNCDLHLR